MFHIIQPAIKEPWVPPITTVMSLFDNTLNNTGAGSDGDAASASAS